MGSRNVTSLHIMAKMQIIFKKTLPWTQISKDLDSDVYTGNSEDHVLIKWDEFENIFLLKYDALRFDQESLKNRIIGLPPDQIKIKPNFEHVVLHYAWKEIFSLSHKEEIKLWKIYLLLFVCNDFTKFNRGMSRARSLDFADLFFEKVVKFIGKENEQRIAANSTFNYPVGKNKGKFLRKQEEQVEQNEKLTPFLLGDSNVRLNAETKLNLNVVRPNFDESYDNLLIEEYKEMEKLFKNHHYKVRKVTVKFLKIFLKATFECVFEEICDSFVEAINKIKRGIVKVNDIYWNNSLKEYIGIYYQKIPFESEKINKSKLENLVNQDFDAFFKIRRNLEKQVLSEGADQIDPKTEKPFYANTESLDRDKVWLTFDDLSSFFNLYSYYTDPIKLYEKYSKST